jgi:hypothetical protein
LHWNQLFIRTMPLPDTSFISLSQQKCQDTWLSL